MAHEVICQECKKRFDRDKMPYVSPRKQRYSHADCYLRARVDNPNLPELTIIDPTDTVTCIYCKQEFKKSLTDFIQISNGKYAHKKCKELEDTREKTPAEQLDDFIMNYFNMTYVSPFIKKQINNYINEYNFTYSGILKSLIYFTEIKKNTLNQNNGIAIVPFIYQNAYNYFYSIWVGQQINDNKNIKNYIPKDTTIVIDNPKRKLNTKKKFVFLDEEEKNGI